MDTSIKDTVPENKDTPSLTAAQKLNLETAKISWQELQKFFAQGLIVVVNDDLDLVETAANFVEDKNEIVEQLLRESKIHKAEIGDAKDWNERNGDFWAVVVAPWVLVQEIT